MFEKLKTLFTLGMLASKASTTSRNSAQEHSHVQAVLPTSVVAPQPSVVVQPPPVGAFVTPVVAPSPKIIPKIQATPVIAPVHSYKRTMPFQRGTRGWGPSYYRGKEHTLDTIFEGFMMGRKMEKERQKAIEGLKERLAKASDLDSARADTKPARTPERTELAARMKRVRRERDVIRSAADKAREAGDDKLFEAIAEIAKVPMARARAVMEKFEARREARRLARARKDRG